MCELLGMSANVPTDICFSFTGLMQRGGGTGPHRDGWGVAFYEGKGIQAFHDPVASVNSELAALLQRHPIKSTTVLCHIRQANVGSVGLVNTHPFIREMWGLYWSFAHNGQLKRTPRPNGRFQPVGETDSEAIFCDLLSLLDAGFPASSYLDQYLPILVDSCHEYAQLGVCNVLLSNGEWLFSYCSTKLTSITRRAPFGPACLRDADVTVDFAEETTPEDIVSVIATEPLTTDERWDDYRVGEWRLWRDGLVVRRGIAG